MTEYFKTVFLKIPLSANYAGFSLAGHIYIALHVCSWLIILYFYSNHYCNIYHHDVANGKILQERKEGESQVTRNLQFCEYHVTQ